MMKIRTGINEIFPQVSKVLKYANMDYKERFTFDTLNNYGIQ